MRMTKTGYAAVLAALVCGSGAARAEQAPQVARFPFSATVQADGTLADIQPDPALPAVFQTMVKRGVAAWRYAPATWQGRTAAAPIAQVITVEVEPRAEGYAFRILGVGEDLRSGEAKLRASAANAPPTFPVELMRRGVNAILVYSVQYDAAGKPGQIDLVHPTTPDADHRRLDAATRAAMTEWTASHSFDGAPVACRTKVPVTFQTGDAEPLPVPPQVDAQFARYPDMCPAAVLQTKVAGSFL